MIKKSFKILLAYIIGVVASLFLTVALSPMLGFSPALFSVITALVTVALMYSEIWKAGKYDALKKATSFKKPLQYMTAFVVISAVIELIIIFYKPAGNVDISMLIGSFWFFPFMGFFSKTNFVPVTVIIVVMLLCISEIAYFAGIKGFSLSDKILNARKKRLDEKAEKHFEEIEKIKEQYRKKK